MDRRSFFATVSAALGAAAMPSVPVATLPGYAAEITGMGHTFQIQWIRAFYNIESGIGDIACCFREFGGQWKMVRKAWDGVGSAMIELTDGVIVGFCAPNTERTPSERGL
jgi:hypothetical protein